MIEKSKKYLKLMILLSIAIINNSIGNTNWNVSDGLENLKPEPGKALCVVIRAHGYSLEPVDIYLDQWRVGYTQANTFSYFSVDPGTHYISFGIENYFSYKRDFREGDIFYLYQKSTVESYTSYWYSYTSHNFMTDFLNRKKFYSIFEEKKSILSINKFTSAKIKKMGDKQYSKLVSDAIFIPLSKDEVYQFVINKVKEEYVDEQLDHVTLDTTGHPSLDTLLDQLDEYSKIYYLDEEDPLPPGELGLRIQKIEDKSVITSVKDEGPASGRGIFRGDTLMTINNTAVHDLDSNHIIKLLHGPIGSTVSLRIKRGDNTLTIRNIKREDFIQKDVEDPLILEDRIGYIKVNSFEMNTEPQINDAIDTLVDDSKCKVIIIDLRNNPGGILASAIDVAELLLPKGAVICQSLTRKSADKKIYRSKDGEYKRIKLIILINENSYSSAEILAWAIKGNKRALIIGTPSKGKACSQHVIPINSDMALSLTTAYFYGPNGEKIHKVGVKPDIVVEMGETSMEEKVYSPLSLRYPENRDPQLKVAVMEAKKLLAR